MCSSYSDVRHSDAHSLDLRHGDAHSLDVSVGGRLSNRTRSWYADSKTVDVHGEKTQRHYTHDKTGGWYTDQTIGLYGDGKTVGLHSDEDCFSDDTKRSLMTQ